MRKCSLQYINYSATINHQSNSLTMVHIVAQNGNNQLSETSQTSKMNRFAKIGNDNDNITETLEIL